MIDDARRELGIEAKPAQIAAKRSGRQRSGSRAAARAARKTSAA